MPRVIFWGVLCLVCGARFALLSNGLSVDEGDEKHHGHECLNSWRGSRTEGYSHLWIETLVVVDHSVRNRFATPEQAQFYVQTLMQMTNDLLHHSSLGANLSLAVREILWISERESNALLWGPSLIRSVHRFCKWALVNHYVRYNYDHALLLSRNIVQAAGISPLGQMCHMQYSCTLAEDSGFFSAYPIAHEIMHSLGIEHDGDGNTCDSTGSAGNIMAPLILSASHNHHWSMCTRLKLRKIRSLNRLACLDDFPIGRDQFLITGLPGRQWSVDEQCRVSTGSNNSRFCANFSDHPCQELWCFMPEPIGKCTQILNQGMLDGTSCGIGGECLQGTCKKKHPEGLLLAGLDDYGPWTTCSRQCGIGTQYRKRRCAYSKELFTNTSACDKDYAEYRLCHNEMECPNVLDDRAIQCSRYNQFKLRGTFHTWLPVVNHTDPCALLCRSEQTGEILNARNAVRDGTPCGYETPDPRCVQSKCVRFDCLGVVNGTTMRDRCGVCKGDGSSCQTLRFDVTRNVTYVDGYPIIHVLPRLVREIRILLKSGNHALGLYDTLKMKFLLGGEEAHLREESSTIQRVFYGTEFTVRTWRTPTELQFESIVARGPILGDLAIRVRQLNNDQKSTQVTLHIKYTIPKNKLIEFNKV